jgi:predicted RNase H-like nuclease (RuvC/YqgF family)
MENPEQEQPIRKDSNKIYFLVAVILALLGTNTYLFFKDKKANDRIITVSDEKTRMQTEIDKIEAELDNATSNNLKLSEEMQKEQEIAREKIDELRNALKQGQLTQGQLAKAQEEIKQLRYFVSKYSTEIDELKKQNQDLTSERNELLSTVDSVSTKANELEKQNEELNTKVQAAAAIKSGNISIAALNIRNNGKESVVTRASTTDKLRVNFSIVNNPLAEKGIHTIFLRVIDPSGNLVISNNGGIFISDDEELQYSYKTAIEFANDGRSYTIDWADGRTYQKGVYTIILYADGYTMGKGSLSLR